MEEEKKVNTKDIKLFDAEFRAEQNALIDLLSNVYFKQTIKDRKLFKKQLWTFISDLDAFHILIDIFREEIQEYMD